jgi:hypothetical protein
MKTTVSVILILFVLASVAWLVFGQSDSPAITDESTSVAEEAAAEVKGDQVLVYYFHGEQRCPTCMKIEALSNQAMQTGFAGEIADGRVVWKVVNYEQPENAHFVDDYELYTKSLIVVKTTDGQQMEWKNLPEIWELVHDDEAFIGYVNSEVDAYLGEA